MYEQNRRDSILKTQALGAEHMAAANMRKAEAIGDHAAMSLFRMPIEDVDDKACEYFKLRRQEELERIKRWMEHEKRQAEREKLDHKNFFGTVPLRSTAASAFGSKPRHPQKCIPKRLRSPQHNLARL